MRMPKHDLYREDVKQTAKLALPWENLAGKAVCIAGASGMIGSFLVDVLMERGNCEVWALGRNGEKARARFEDYWENAHFHFVQQDINREIVPEVGRMDYLIHAASNTHPLAYASDPIGTITTNIIGTANLLDLAVRMGTKRVIFASSVEIYGENRGDCERFDENSCGYLDCNTLRAGYPEGKRAGEALCQAYIAKTGLDIVIPRLSRTYGPTMQSSDSKAIAQFLKKAAAGEDIVLKSEGNQLYSYSYVADAAAGLLYCLFCGKCGEAYNIADEGSDIRLRELAEMIAAFAGRKVVFELPDETEKAGYSRATKALLDAGRLKSLGWRARYDMCAGVERTLRILKEDR